MKDILRRYAFKIVACWLVVSAFVLLPFYVAEAAEKYPANDVLLNGQPVPLSGFNVDGNNYFALDDIAYLLGREASQFEIEGRLAAVEIDGENFFKLRDLGEIFGFSVVWDADAQAVNITYPLILLMIDDKIVDAEYFYNFVIAERQRGINHDIIATNNLLQINTRPAQGSAEYWREIILATHSAKILPDARISPDERLVWEAEYAEIGGYNAFEVALLYEVNRVRYSYGLNKLIWDYELGMASRFFAQLVVNLNFNRREAEMGVIHGFGPYGGSNGVARFFGVFNRRGANGAWGTFCPEMTVALWMESPGHRENVLREGVVSAGAGSHLGGYGQFGVVHYFMLR